MWFDGFTDLGSKALPASVSHFLEELVIDSVSEAATTKHLATYFSSKWAGVAA